MAKFFNLHYISDLAAYTKGQGIPHHKPDANTKLGTIISFSESDVEDKPEDLHVPFGVSVKTIPVEGNTYSCTMKADGASQLNTYPTFLHAESRQIIKRVDVNTGELVDNDVPVQSMPGHLKFTNPDMVPPTRR